MIDQPDGDPTGPAIAVVSPGTPRSDRAWRAQSATGTGDWPPQATAAWPALPGDLEPSPAGVATGWPSLGPSGFDDVPAERPHVDDMRRRERLAAEQRRL